MMTIESYVRRGKRQLGRLAGAPRVRQAWSLGRWTLAGLVLSAISLANSPQPAALGLVLALTGYRAAVAALGAGAGYLLFWGMAGLQGLLWLALGLPLAMLLGKRPVVREVPLLLPSIGGLLVSAAGLFFQLAFSDPTSVPVYLLRVGLGAGATWLFGRLWAGREPVTDTLAGGVAVLALAQVAPFGFSLGFPAAALLTAWGSFPAAALAGLALDLARVSPVPMTAVLPIAWLSRLIPQNRRSVIVLAPAVAYILLMGLSGVRDHTPVAGLLLGGALSLALPAREPAARRRGETGLAQVRLELAAGTLSRTQQLLLGTREPPIDEEALLRRCRERACGSCPCRKTCQDRLEPLPTRLLRDPLLDLGAVPGGCKKPARLLLELRRSQEQLRQLRADRERQREYRTAVVQQYQFLAEYLRQTADRLGTLEKPGRLRYQVEVRVRSRGRETANGDRCLAFAGPYGKYFVLLCDGMGTGLGAAQSGKEGADLLRQLLTAGFPAEYALRSVNSLLALAGRAGAVTLDLAEVDLTTGRTAVYKWGAAPSYVLRRSGAEKIGTATPPPGLSVKEGRETVERLSLGRGEMLILLSDGVDGEEVLRRIRQEVWSAPGEVAAKFLTYGADRHGDDATAAVLLLRSCALSPSYHRKDANAVETQDVG